MEFDKSRILTVATANNLKCKQKGWIHNNISLLRIEMNTFDPYPVFLNNDLELPFISEGKSGMFFYPAPEPTYYPFKIGDKVIVDTNDFYIATVIDPCDEEDFMYVDMEHIRTGVKKHSCKLVTYRQYNSDELNNLVGKIVVRKCDGNKMLVNGRISPIKVRLGNDCTYTAEQLLELFTLNDEPCGVKEKACIN